MPNNRKSPKKEAVRVSLLPAGETFDERAEVSYGRRIIVILIILVALAGAVSGYLRFSAKKIDIASKKLQAELNTFNAQVQESERVISELGNIGQKIGFAKSMLGTHIASAKILEILESAATDGVILNNLAADAKGSLVISAKGESFRAVARQIIAWEDNPEIASVKVSGVASRINTLGEVESIDFGASFNLKSDVLTWNP